MARLLALGLLALCACGPSDVLDSVDPSIFEADVTYRARISPIYRKRCIGCHTSAGLRLGGVELDTYEAAAGSRLRSACTSAQPELLELFDDTLRQIRSGVFEEPCDGWKIYSMPDGAKSRMSPNEQALLLRWIELGAPE